MAARCARGAAPGAARRGSLLAACAVLAALSRFCAGPCLALSGWRQNHLPGQKVLVWYKSRWQDGLIEVSGQKKVEVRVGEDRVKVPRDSPDIQPVMEDRGMSLKQLRRFWQHCLDNSDNGYLTDPETGEKISLQDASTKQITRIFIMELTGNGAQPFVDVMTHDHVWPDEAGPGSVSCFVSHAWRCSFHNMLRQLEEVGGGIFWIDCFACTQGADRMELLDDSEVFAKALQASGTRVQVLCMDAKATALQRLWVIFEILRGYEADKPLRIPSPQGVEKGLRSIRWGSLGCTVERDRQYIMQQVSKIGISSVSDRVRQALLNSFETSKRVAAVDHGLYSAEHARARHTYAVQLLEAGKYAEAKEESAAALNLLRELFEERDPDVAVARRKHAAVLKTLGHHQEAKEEFAAALDILRHHSDYGERHPDVATVRSNLGLVLNALGHHQEQGTTYCQFSWSPHFF